MPKHETLRVAVNTESGSKTIRHTQNAVVAAVQTYQTIFSEVQRTPLTQSADKNAKARNAAIPRKTLPTALSADCCMLIRRSILLRCHRFLVASADMRDLLVRAKDLFGGAIRHPGAPDRRVSPRPLQSIASFARCCTAFVRATDREYYKTAPQSEPGFSDFQ
jgi:hypothetical protein